MKDHDQMQLVKVLWTGGFDSSLRMIQLSKLRVVVQPYYLVDSKFRRSIKNELNAICAITEDIRMNPGTRCVILPLIKVEVADIEIDYEISQACKSIRRKIPLGSQYDWLSSFSKSNPGLELCFEKDESADLYYYLKKYEIMQTVQDDMIEYCKVDETKSDNDVIKVFGSFHFPLPLLQTTKYEMIKEYKIMGFESTMNKTWFCHTPVNNRPCGVCVPCTIAIKEGLTFRFPEEALKRHRTDVALSGYFFYSIYKKFRYRVKGY